MTTTLAFDIYGTLIDPHAVVVQLREYVGEQAPFFSKLWREKQLEYSFRRGLMRRYQNFEHCTRQALDYTDAIVQSNLSEVNKTALMASYRLLPAYDDVHENLETISKAGWRLFGFSNGTTEAVSSLLKQAGIACYFETVVSVDSLQTYKPNPDVYQYFIDSTGSDLHHTWLISANPFDVMGAVNIGMRSIWLQRSPESIFDPWNIAPTAVIADLSELSGVVTGV